MIEPVRKVSDLDARVSRAVDAAEGPANLESLLAERLAVALAIFASLEIDFDLERHDRGEPNPWREYRAAILDADVGKIARQRWMKTVFYEEAIEQVRRLYRAERAKRKAVTD